jgi:hypothetical protein
MFIFCDLLPITNQSQFQSVYCKDDRSCTKPKAIRNIKSALDDLKDNLLSLGCRLEGSGKTALGVHISKIDSANAKKEDVEKILPTTTSTTTVPPSTKKVFEDKCAGFEPVQTNRTIYCFLSKVYVHLYHF